jgi:hypothetical protein
MGWWMIDQGKIEVLGHSVFSPVVWRYYPQALEISDDLAADWFLGLWAQC